MAPSTEFERRRPVDRAGRPAGAAAAWPAELVLAADQFIIEPTTRLPDEVRAARRGRRSALRDRRLSLVYRLGPRHHDQSRRPDVHHRSLSAEARLHPAHFRPSRSRRADSQPVSRRQRTRACTTRPTPRCGTFTPWTRYLQRPHDREYARALAAHAARDRARHLRGTRFGIGVDPADGLLRQGEEGYQLTWMDAKMDDWVVTPRRGKAVEINALWYNALRLLSQWLADAGAGPAGPRAGVACRPRAESFNARFWYGERGWLYDVIDGPQDWTRRCDRISCWPSHCITRCWTKAAGRACSRAFANTCSRRLACERLPRSSRTTNRSTLATCGPAMRPIIRARFGPG